MWFLANFRMHMCVCVGGGACMCAQLSAFQTPITHEQFEILSWNLIHQWSNHAPSFVTVFLQIDAPSEIRNFWKNVHGSSKFRKIWAIIVKLHTNIIYWKGTFGRNRLKRSNFLKIFSKLSNSGKFRVIELKFRARMH